VNQNRILGRRRDRDPEPDPYTPEPPDDKTRLALRVSDAAKELCISPAYAYTLIHEGRLPHIRLGRRIVILRSDLVTWVESESQRQADPQRDSDDQRQ
jgi:excisionase family DNA binding protein